MGKVQREKEGNNGGVVKIAYLCAFAPSENVSLIEAQGGQIPDFYDVKVRKSPRHPRKVPVTYSYFNPGALGDGQRSGADVLPRS